MPSGLHKDVTKSLTAKPPVPSALGGRYARPRAGSGPDIWTADPRHQSVPDAEQRFAYLFENPPKGPRGDGRDGCRRQHGQDRSAGLRGGRPGRMARSVAGSK